MRPNSRGDQVHGAAVRERSRILRELAAQKNRRFRERQVAGELEVVTLESAASGNGTSALSDNFLDVVLPGVQLPANRLIRVRVNGLSEEGLIAEPAKTTQSESNSHVAERPDAPLTPATSCPSIITSAMA